MWSYPGYVFKKDSIFQRYTLKYLLQINTGMGKCMDVPHGVIVVEAGWWYIEVYDTSLPTLGYVWNTP